MKPPVRSLFKHPGGKSRVASRILPLLQAHECYVEPFCGAANVFFQKPHSPVEVLNDSNGEIANAFNCVRLHCDAVLQELHLVINSREHFQAWRKQTRLTDIQRAARFLYLKALSFGGDGESFGVQRTSGGGAATNLGVLQETIATAHLRLQGVIIEAKDWRDCVRVYDSPDTLFYLDPPYIGGAQKCYDSWKLTDFSELVETLRGIQGRFVLSFSDSPDVRRTLRGFRVKRFSRARGIRHGTYDEVIATSA